MNELKSRIEEAYDLKDKSELPSYEKDVHQCIDGLDSGNFRICEKISDGWVVHQWLKK
jgi:2,3,4,5-tetrahydropyridine-2,6-dicarboxylate N-succinyltransferase